MLQEQIRLAKADDNPIEEEEFIGETLAEVVCAKIDLKGVRLIDCKFERCDFSRAGFYNCVFSHCDFSNCTFTDSYWKRSRVENSRGDGTEFSGTHFKESVFVDCSFCYANFTKASFENFMLERCLCKEAFFTEARIKKMSFDTVDLSRADFFKTPLKGVDLSSSVISGIMVSDSFRELAGAKIDLSQAVDIAVMLGVKIV